MDLKSKNPTAVGLKARPILSDISVVIPTLGRPILAENLGWIACGTVWPGCVIIVDQGSNQEVAHWIVTLQAAGMNARHLHLEPCGPAAAVNFGLGHVETRLIAITDDDCFVGEHWLENVARMLSMHPDAVITGRVEPGRENVMAAVTSPSPKMSRRPSLLFDTLSRGNMAASTAVFSRVGPFDEVLRAAEDAEWAYRALRAGVPIVYAPEVVVRHFEWSESDGLGAKYAAYAYNHGVFYGRYMRRGDAFIAMRAMLHHLRSLRRWVRDSVRGDVERSQLGRAYFLGLMPGIIAGMRRSAAE